MFDEDYFERGIESGKSCYQNYRWIPELTIPMAMCIIDTLGIEPHHTILDYGCAKGYLVKAFRWLNRRAWGVDISVYAISNCDPEVEEFCVLDGKPDRFLDGLPWYDFVIAKDVFEHIGIEDLHFLLSRLEVGTIFAIVPLADNGIFRAPSNNMDVSHVTRLNEREWEYLFFRSGWKVNHFTYKVSGIKDSYYDKFPKAHGFFTLGK